MGSRITETWETKEEEIAVDLGCANSIGVKQFGGGVIDAEMNRWFNDHPDLEILDIKYAASSTPEDWAVDALIIYRRSPKTEILW
ncbi:hypothetical protein [Terribacillus sp. JSM ZJ617]|uniref:hypothetical protein n=1 Tax=Terribacillus sp. JSM ZJ617 TaxID=3342119 RepID=UPI0035A881D9